MILDIVGYGGGSLLVLFVAEVVAVQNGFGWTPSWFLGLPGKLLVHFFSALGKAAGHVATVLACIIDYIDVSVMVQAAKNLWWAVADFVMSWTYFQAGFRTIRDKFKRRSKYTVSFAMLVLIFVLSNTALWLYLARLPTGRELVSGMIIVGGMWIVLFMVTEAYLAFRRWSGVKAAVAIPPGELFDADAIAPEFPAGPSDQK